MEEEEANHGDGYESMDDMEQEETNVDAMVADDYDDDAIDEDDGEAEVTEERFVTLCIT